MTSATETTNIEIESTADRKEPSPMPAFIKWGLIGLVVIVAAAIVFVMMIAGPDKESEVAADKQTDALEITPMSETLEQGSGSKAAGKSPSNGSPLYLAKVKDSLENFDRRVRETESRVANINSRLDSDINGNKRLAADVTRLSEELADISTALAELVAKVDDLDVRWATQNEEVESLSKQLVKSRKAATRRKVVPKFSLLSIDRWGGRESAVIDLNGQVTTASVGDSRAGWTILSFDRPGCINVERERDRVHASVCIPKGGS